MHWFTQHADQIRRPRNLIIGGVLLLLVLTATVLARPFSGRAAGSPPFHDLTSYIAWVQSHHKAPFDRDGSLSSNKGGAAFIKKTQGKAPLAAASSAAAANIQVNQDRNPWPKAELGAAVNPANGSDYVVMENDFRQNFDHEIYHTSTDGGLHFTDDSATVGVDGFANAPYNFQSDPGVAFDSVGHSYISFISGNLIFDFINGYLNQDTEVDMVQGFANGQYTNITPTPIDFQPCNGLLTGTINCPAILDKPLITVDNVPGSPNEGSIYVYYTLFCNGAGPTGTDPCIDGSATIPPFSSAILESHSAGAGLPFSTVALVSGSFTQEQFSDMVVDSHGTPHMFFDDFTNPLAVNMYESTFSGGAWTVNATPVATFTYNGLNNLNNWQFRDAGAAAPGCGISKDTAYCAFSAQQIGSGKIESTPSVYVAKVNTLTGASTTHRVNNDAFGDGKDHFFAWATVAPSGAVYVGWYDNRNDPFNVKVEYFVGKSTNGGSSFATQKAVSTASFNPCTGFPGCGFFGDYTQIVSGPDGVVHAAWSDTRDGASMQVFSARVTW